MQNPTINCYRENESKIQETRDFVFMNMEKRSHRLSVGAQKIHERIINSSRIPTLGELVPWIIHGLFGTDLNKTKQVAIGWLEVYLYTSLIDDIIDNQRVPEADELLAGSVLFQDGVLRLQKLVHGTKYEQVLSNALFQSADFEILDAFSQSEKTPQTKRKIAEGKNFILLACAAALAANNKYNGEQTMKFTSAIITGFQFLDDIADWEEDYKNGNYTKLIATAYQRLVEKHGKTIEFKKISNKEMLFHLLNTGALTDLLEETKEILKHAIFVATPSAEINTTSAHFFLQELYLNLDFAKKDIEEAREKILLIPNKNIEGILRQVERTIQIVAQST